MITSFRPLSVMLACLVAIALPLAANAHHGWAWADGEEAEVTGTIQSVRLGNPHGEVTLMVGDQTWTAEVGQPWRNERAGLTEAMLSEGTEITIHGHRSSQEGEYLIKAERVIIDGQSYNLYPNRAS